MELYWSFYGTYTIQNSDVPAVIDEDKFLFNNTSTFVGQFMSSPSEEGWKS